MRKFIKRQRAILGCLKGVVGRKMSMLSKTVQETLGQTLDKAKRLVTQTPSRKAVNNLRKLYIWHASEVERTSKGKCRNPFEFGLKVGLAITLKGKLFVGDKRFRANPSDGHTIHEQIGQRAILMEGLGVNPEVVYADEGYRGVNKNYPQIVHKHPGKDKQINDKERRLLKQLQAIEPIIEHLKADHRMDCCHLKGSEVDALHAVLCAVGYNIRWLLRMIVKKDLGLLLYMLEASGLAGMIKKFAEFFGRNRLHNSDHRWVLA